jgi:glyoxylase I family protein
LEIGGVYCIELFSFPNPPQRVSHPEAAGLRHLAFEVDSIEEAVQYLREHDVNVEEIRTDSTTGKRYTFFSDPDNLPLELYEK